VRHALLLALALLTLAPDVARADGPHPQGAPGVESGDGLSAPREGSTHRRRRRRHRRHEEPRYVITGPHVELGWTHYWLPYDGQAGDVNVGTFSGFLATGKIRAGGTLEGGVREYTLGPNPDAVVRGQIFVGYQALGAMEPVVPWITGNLGLGVVIAQRFGSGLAYATWSFGVEGGADLYAVKGFHLGGALAFEYYAVGNLGYPIVSLRLYAGL
jgi:hypothetical protein